MTIVRNFLYVPEYGIVLNKPSMF